MADKRLKALLAAGPKISRADRKRLRGFQPRVTPIALGVHMACMSMRKVPA